MIDKHEPLFNVLENNSNDSPALPRPCQALSPCSTRPVIYSFIHTFFHLLIYPFIHLFVFSLNVSNLNPSTMQNFSGQKSKEFALKVSIGFEPRVRSSLALVENDFDNALILQFIAILAIIPMDPLVFHFRTAMRDGSLFDVFMTDYSLFLHTVDSRVYMLRLNRCQRFESYLNRELQ